MKTMSRDILVSADTTSRTSGIRRMISLQSLLQTEASGTQTMLRLVLAGVMFPHGAQHVLGWFGGYGLSATVGWMSASLGIPVALATFAMLVELLAPIALVVGLGGRFAGVGLAGLMVVAAQTHAGNGFFMNWFGTLEAGAEGFEYHLLAIAIALAVAVRGSGAFSLDRWLTGRRAEQAI
jgi:putative oxidoreductase